MRYSSQKGAQIMEKFRILITGGAGFVGRNLVRVLHPKKYDMHEVTVLDEDQSNLAFVKRYGVQTQCVALAEKREWCDAFTGGVAVGLKKMQAWFTENWTDIVRRSKRCGF